MFYNISAPTTIGSTTGPRPGTMLASVRAAAPNTTAAPTPTITEAFSIADHSCPVLETAVEIFVRMF